MYGSLWSIIFSFYFDFFCTQADPSVTNFYGDFTEFGHRLMNFIVGYNDSSGHVTGWWALENYFEDAYNYDINDEMFACVFADIFTIITIIIFILLLFKLFKWIFKLIFKSFRLD